MSQRALAATGWSAADILLRHGIQFVVIVALARLLTPAEFGTVALLSLFTGVAAVILDGGMSTALIQRQDITRIDESTVFWANVAVGLLLAAALGAAAPAIAAFYDSPVLLPLTLTMAANVVISAFAATQVTLLTKRLDFRTLLKAGLVSSIVSGGVAIFLASRGYGVWALAAQTLVMSGLTTAMLWILSEWRPLLTFSRDSARKLIGFGGFVLLANLSDVIFTRAYTVLAGKLFGIREVGFYNRADTSQQLPVDLLSSIVSRVALPLFSAAAADTVELRRGTRMAIRTLMLVNVPAMLGLAAAAEPFVLALFGSQWAPVTPLLQVLCLAGLFWPLHVINVQVLLAQGHARLLLLLELVKKSVGVGLLIAGAMIFGLLGLAWSQVAFGMFAFVVNAFYTKRFLDYGAWAQLRDSLPVLAVAVPIAALARFVVTEWQAEPVLEIVVVGVLGGSLFFAVARVVRLSALGELLVLVKGAGASQRSSLG